MAAGARNVANVAGAPIEATSPKMGAFLDNGATLFQDFARGQGSNPDKGQANENPIGRLQASSHAFAAFLDLDGYGEQEADGVSGKGNSSLAATISRAINAYETNARVISGDNVPLGNSLSLEL